MISYPLTLPATPGIRRIQLTMVNVVAVVQSPFTLEQQTQQKDGQAWRAGVELPPMLRPAAEAWVAALGSLMGRYGTFLLGDPEGATPRGSALGSPVVNGSGQTGLELDTDGWTPNASGVLLPGDYIQLGTGASSRLYKVLTQANADLYGNATLDIWPRLRESPSDAATITLTNTKGRFRLASNDLSWDSDHLHLFGVTFAAVEAI